MPIAPLKLLTNPLINRTENKILKISSIVSVILNEVNFLPKQASYDVIYCCENNRRHIINMGTILGLKAAGR